MSEADLRRMAFVTRHYADLRMGVLRAAGAPILLVAGFAAGKLPGGSLLLTALLVLALSGASLNRWLDQRFGRVVSNGGHRRQLVLLWLATFLVVTRMGHLGVETSPYVLLFVAAAAYGLWLGVHLWPFGVHNLLPAVIALGASVFFGSGENREALLLWERSAFVVMLLAWSAAGLMDLALLMKVLPYRQREHVDVDAS